MHAPRPGRVLRDQELAIGVSCLPYLVALWVSYSPLLAWLLGAWLIVVAWLFAPMIVVGYCWYEHRVPPGMALGAMLAYEDDLDGDDTPVCSDCCSTSSSEAPSPVTI